MNTADGHVSEELLEKYAMGKLSAQKSASLEEHLVFCEFCRTKLESLDEFVQVMKASLKDCPRTPCRPKPKLALVRSA